MPYPNVGVEGEVVFENGVKLIYHEGSWERSYSYTRSEFQLINVDPILTVLHTTGFDIDDDGGAWFYDRVAAEPAHELKVQSLNGVWFEGRTNEQDLIDPTAMGAIADFDGTTGTENAAIYNDAFAASVAIGGAGVCVPVGRSLANGVVVPDGQTLTGKGPQSILELNDDTVNLISVGNDTTVKGFRIRGNNTGSTSGVLLTNGIAGVSVTNVEISDMMCEDFGNADPTLDGCGAITFFNATSNLRIYRNYITGGLGYAVSADINFYNNQIHTVDCSHNYCMSANRQGIAFQFGGVQGVDGGRRIVSNNICANHEDHGISLGYADAASNHTEVICEGNILYNNAGTGIYYASGVQGGGSIAIRNNNISNCGGFSVTNGEPLNGGIVVSGDDPMSITNNFLYQIGIEPGGAVGAASGRGCIHAIGSQIDVVGNIMRDSALVGLGADFNSTRLYWVNNTIINCGSAPPASQVGGGGMHVNMSNGFEEIYIHGNLIRQETVDSHCVNIAHLGAHGNDGFVFTNNRMYGSNGTATNAGLRMVFSVIGEISDNRAINCARGFDLGGNVAADNYNATDTVFRRNVMEDCAIGMRYFINATASSPFFLDSDNIFRNNTTDILSANAALGVHYFLIGDVPGGARMFWSDGIPNPIGTFFDGDRAINSNPATGDPHGWVVAAGDGGVDGGVTWTPLPTI